MSLNNRRIVRRVLMVSRLSSLVMCLTCLVTGLLWNSDDMCEGESVRRVRSWWKGTRSLSQSNYTIEGWTSEGSFVVSKLIVGSDDSFVEEIRKRNNTWAPRSRVLPSYVRTCAQNARRIRSLTFLAFQSARHVH